MAPPLMVGAAMLSVAQQAQYLQAPRLKMSLEPLVGGGFAQMPPSYCTTSFGNSSFNLVPLKLNTGFWYLEDDRNNAGKSENYTYLFNVCSNIDYNAFFPSLDYCNGTFPGAGGTSDPNQRSFGPAPAFQLSNWADQDALDKCHKLGGDLTVNPGNMQWGLYDNTNPAVGVVLSYTGGDFCPRVDPARNRSLRLWINCYNDAGALPRKETVLETEACTYDIFINSALGCPAECPRVPTADGSSSYICARHGVCDYDPEINNARCFCNDGWSGSDCASPASPPPSGLSATSSVLLTVSLLLIATLAFLVYLWRRIQGLRLDPSAYGTLRGGEEVEAMAS